MERLIWRQLRRAELLPQDEALELMYNSPALAAITKANIPRLSEVREEWDLLLKAADTIRLKEGGTDLHAPLTVDESKRRRFRKTAQAPYNKLGPRYGPFIQAGLEMLNKSVRGNILATLRTLGLFDCTLLEQVRDILKLLSDYAKKFGDQVWADDWKFYHGMDLGGGYLEAVPVETFVDDIRDWSEKESEIKVPRDLFRLGVKDCLNQGTYEANGINLVEWAQSYSWPRAGSSDGPRLQVEVDGKLRKARKSKNASALAMTPEQVVLRVLAKTEQRNKAVQKRELGKVRAVVAGDLDLYLKMSYIDAWLFAGMKGTKWSTLFYTPEGFSDLWTDLGDFSRESVRVPLDQSKFDHQAAKWMVLDTVEEIKLLIEDRVVGMNRVEMLEVMDLIAWALNHGGTWVGKTFIPYLNGVMSGWKWTALIDSIINWAELFAARRWVERNRAGGDPVLSAVVQGDDSRVKVATFDDAISLVHAYDQMNIIINPKKFFVSNTRDEYLRKVGEKQATSGYFWRAVPALFWRNPISRDPPPGQFRVREQLTSWMSCVSRGATWDKVRPMMLKDMASGNHLSEEVINGWLNTASSLGGGGMSMEVKGYNILPGQRAPEGAKIVNAPGVDYISKEFGMSKEWLSRELLDRVELPPQTRWKEQSFPEVREVSSRFGQLRFGTHSTTLRPDFKPEIPVWIQGTVVRYAVREGNWNYLEKVMTPKGYSFFKDFSQRASKGVLAKWLEGKLPDGVPTIVGWSTAYISQLGSRWWERAMKGTLALSKVRNSDLNQAALWAEFKTRQFMETQTPSVRVGE